MVQPHFAAPVGVLGCPCREVLLVGLFGEVFLIDQPHLAVC